MCSGNPVWRLEPSKGIPCKRVHPRTPLQGIVGAHCFCCHGGLPGLVTCEEVAGRVRGAFTSRAIPSDDWTVVRRVARRPRTRPWATISPSARTRSSSPLSALSVDNCGANGGPGWPIGFGAKGCGTRVQGIKTVSRSGHSGPFSIGISGVSGVIGRLQEPHFYYPRFRKIRSPSWKTGPPPTGGFG